MLLYHVPAPHLVHQCCCRHRVGKQVCVSPLSSRPFGTGGGSLTCVQDACCHSLLPCTPAAGVRHLKPVAAV
jgi:hypothetical protein